MIANTTYAGDVQAIDAVTGRVIAKHKANTFWLDDESLLVASAEENGTIQVRDLTHHREGIVLRGDSAEATTFVSVRTATALLQPALTRRYECGKRTLDVGYGNCDATRQPSILSSSAPMAEQFGRAAMIGLCGPGIST